MRCINNKPSGIFCWRKVIELCFSDEKLNPLVACRQNPSSEITHEGKGENLGKMKVRRMNSIERKKRALPVYIDVRPGKSAPSW